MFKVLHSGKRKKKSWKRMVTKVTFVGPSFTRKPPKYERFIRPSGEPPKTVAGIATSASSGGIVQIIIWPVTPRCGCTGLRMKKAHVTHPELKCTFCLDILGVKKNPNGTSYTQLGVITKGTVIEVCTSLPAFLCSSKQDHTMRLCLDWRAECDNSGEGCVIIGMSCCR